MSDLEHGQDKESFDQLPDKGSYTSDDHEPQSGRRSRRRKWRRRFLIGGWVFIGLVTVVIVLSVVLGDGSGSQGGGDARPASTSQAEQPPPPPTVREQIEDCFDPWDGHHTGFEDQIRPLLNDEDSMETHDTRFTTTPDANDEVQIIMEYSARNAFGGRVKTVALGKMNYKTCRVTVIDTGL